MGFRTAWRHWLWLQVWDSRETAKVGCLSNKDRGLLIPDWFWVTLSLIYKRKKLLLFYIFFFLFFFSAPLSRSSLPLFCPPLLFSLLSVSLPLTLSFTAHSIPWVSLTPSLESSYSCFFPLYCSPVHSLFHQFPLQIFIWPSSFSALLSPLFHSLSVPASSSSSLLHHKVDGWMIHLSPSAPGLLWSLFYCTVKADSPFFLQRLSVLCSYWHLSTKACTVNTDNSLHLKQWPSHHLFSKYCSADILWKVWIQSEFYSAIDLTWGSCLRRHFTPRYWFDFNWLLWMNVAISSPAILLWALFIFMRQVDPCFNRLLQTTHSHSLHTSIFPEDGLRRRSIGLMT